MNAEITTAELEAYLDEALDAERMAEIERALRGRPELLQRLSQINARRDCGVHTVGEIWRRHHIGVPTREELGSYLLGVLPKDHAAYIRFRVATLKCRYTTPTCGTRGSTKRRRTPGDGPPPEVLSVQRRTPAGLMRHPDLAPALPVGSRLNGAGSRRNPSCSCSCS